MELFDYVKYRWMALLVLFVVGVGAIAYAGHESQSSLYHARTQLLLRPPAGQPGNNNTDTEQYISTQLVLMFTPDYLEAEVAGTGVSAQQARQQLDYDHTSGSEFVVLEASSRNPQKAVALVNAVATNYLAYSAQQNAKPAQQQADLLTKQITASRKALARANATIQNQTSDFLAANPDVKNVDPYTVAPKAAATQSIQSSRLQQLLQQQSQLQLTQAQVVARSEVLRPAVAASLTPGWGNFTYLAAFAGLILVLLTLAGVGLGLSSRVISQSRWALASGGGHLARAVRLRSATGRGRADTVRRVKMALAAVDEPGATTATVFVPQAARGVRRRTSRLFASLEEQGWKLQEVGSVADLMSDADLGEGAATPSRVLLVVDLNRARLDDVGVLADYPESVRRVLVPVLV